MSDRDFTHQVNGISGASSTRQRHLINNSRHVGVVRVGSSAAEKFHLFFQQEQLDGECRTMKANLQEEFIVRLDCRKLIS